MSIRHPCTHVRSRMWLVQYVYTGFVLICNACMRKYFMLASVHACVYLHVFYMHMSCYIFLKFQYKNEIILGIDNFFEYSCKDLSIFIDTQTCDLIAIF